MFSIKILCEGIQKARATSAFTCRFSNICRRHVRTSRNWRIQHLLTSNIFVVLLKNLKEMSSAAAAVAASLCIWHCANNPLAQERGMFSFLTVILRFELTYRVRSSPLTFNNATGTVYEPATLATVYLCLSN